MSLKRLKTACSLQEGNQPLEETSTLRVGDWFRKRRETDQLDQLDGVIQRDVKKARISPPENDVNDEPPEYAGHDDDQNSATPTNRDSSGANLSGVTGGSSNEANGPTGDDGTVQLDENPRMKTLVGDDEPSVVVDGQDDDNKGGPSHQTGVGAPLQQRNSRARVLTDKIDETDPKGWKTKPVEELPEGRKIGIQKGNPAMSSLSFLKDGKRVADKEQSGQESLSRRKKSKKTQSAMNLAWLSLWWRWMEREAEKETSLETDRKNGENLRKLLFIKHKSSSTFPEKSVAEGEGGVVTC